MTLNDIQTAIVEERNNHGDYSVSGDDLKLAAAAAIIAFDSANEIVKAKMMGEANRYRAVLAEQCTSLGIAGFTSNAS